MLMHPHYLLLSSPLGLFPVPYPPSSSAAEHRSAPHHLFSGVSVGFDTSFCLNAAALLHVGRALGPRSRLGFQRFGMFLTVWWWRRMLIVCVCVCWMVNQLPKARELRVLSPTSWSNYISIPFHHFCQCPTSYRYRAYISMQTCLSFRIISMSAYT